MKRKLIMIIALVFSVLLIAGCAPSAPDTPTADTEVEDTMTEGVKEEVLTLAFLGPLTGEAAEIGEGARDALQLSVEEINEAGGVNGKQLNIIYEDGGCDPKMATTAITKLVTIDKVPVVMGGLCSAETFAASSIAEENKVVMISYCSSAPKISDAGDYIFRTYPSDAYQGVFAAEYVVNDLGAKTAGVIYVNDDWGEGLKETFTKKFEELGGEVQTVETFVKGSTDVRTELTKIKAGNPDVVYMPSFTAGTLLILKQAKELGIEAIMLGGDGSFDESVASGDSEYTAGFKTSVVASEFSDELKQKIQERFGHGESVCAVQAYDLPKLMAQVITEAGTDSTAIKDALYKTTYNGVSGSISFDEKGDLIGAAYKVMEVQDGEWVKIK